jgi:hypothetical protein
VALIKARTGSSVMDFPQLEEELDLGLDPLDVVEL